MHDVRNDALAPSGLLDDLASDASHIDERTGAAMKSQKQLETKRSPLQVRTNIRGGGLWGHQML